MVPAVTVPALSVRITARETPPVTLIYENNAVLALSGNKVGV